MFGPEPPAHLPRRRQAKFVAPDAALRPRPRDPPRPPDHPAPARRPAIERSVRARLPSRARPRATRAGLSAHREVQTAPPAGDRPCPDRTPTASYAPAARRSERPNGHCASGHTARTSHKPGTQPAMTVYPSHHGLMPALTVKHQGDGCSPPPTAAASGTGGGEPAQRCDATRRIRERASNNGSGGTRCARPGHIVHPETGEPRTPDRWRNTSASPAASSVRTRLSAGTSD